MDHFAPTGQKPKKSPQLRGLLNVVGMYWIMNWWTRSQRIRTTLVIPFEAVFLEATAPPSYQIIAAEAQHLQKLSLSAARIAQSLGVTDKTVTKALAWLAHHEE